MKFQFVSTSALGAALLFAPCVVSAQNVPATNEPAQNQPSGLPSPQTPQLGNASSLSSQQTPGVTRPNSSAFAQDTSTTGSGGTDHHATADKVFLRKAAEGGYAEIQLGQLAAQKASSDDVKKFGQKMVDDHTKLNSDLKPFADQAGVKTPEHLNKMDQAEYDKLNGLSGQEFDKEYTSFMAKDHRKDLREFRQEASTTTDPSLKQTVMDGEKVIQEHSRMANQLAAANGGSAGTSK